MLVGRRRRRWRRTGPERRQGFSSRPRGRQGRVPYRRHAPDGVGGAAQRDGGGPERALAPSSSALSSCSAPSAHVTVTLGGHSAVAEYDEDGAADEARFGSSGWRQGRRNLDSWSESVRGGGLQIAKLQIQTPQSTCGGRELNFEQRNGQRVRIWKLEAARERTRECTKVKR